MRNNKESNVKQHNISILGNEVGVWIEIGQDSIGREYFENEANHNVVGNSQYRINEHTKHYFPSRNRN